MGKKITWKRDGCGWTATIRGEVVSIQPIYKTDLCATIKAWSITYQLRPMRVYRLLSTAKAGAAS